MAIKLICGSFLVVVLLGCLSDAKSIAPNPHSPVVQTSHNQRNQNPYNQQVHGGGKNTHDEEFHSCDVAESDRVECGEKGIAQSECERINCCYSPRGCFFGKVATLHCTTNGDIILAVARDATVPSIDVNSLSLFGSDGSCRPHISSAFIVYEFKPNQCGTQINEEEDGVLVYQNKLSSTFEIQTSLLGDITRDTVFEIDFQCRYNGRAIEAVIFKPLTLPDPVPFATYGNLRVDLRLGNGQCISKGCVEDDVAFTSYYSVSDYPVAKVLREYVYVEVRLLDRNDPNLHLRLGNCWVTTSEDAYSPHRWDLLLDGCPNRQDSDPPKLIAVDPSTLEYPTHYKRFAFKMFAFVLRAVPANPGKKTQYDAEVVEPLRDQLYIHCECSVCIPSAMDNCESACHTRKKRDTGAAKMAYREEKLFVTGPSVVVSGDA